MRTKRIAAAFFCCALPFSGVFAEEKNGDDGTVPVDKARALYSLLENMEGQKSLFPEEVDALSLKELLDEQNSALEVKVFEDTQNLGISFANVFVYKKALALCFSTTVRPDKNLSESEYIRYANDWNCNHIFSRVFWKSDAYQIDYYATYKGGIHADNFNEMLGWFFENAVGFYKYLRADGIVE